ALAGRLQGNDRATPGATAAAAFTSGTGRPHNDAGILRPPGTPSKTAKVGDTLPFKAISKAIGVSPADSKKNIRPDPEASSTPGADGSCTTSMTVGQTHRTMTSSRTSVFVRRSMSACSPPGPQTLIATRS